MCNDNSINDNEKPHSVSHFDLSIVKDKIKQRRVRINENARQGALRDFQWGPEGILKCYLKLKPQHFIKSDLSRTKSIMIVDSYMGYINNETIYTHFYIDVTGDLVINSFHKPLYER